MPKTLQARLVERIAHIEADAWNHLTGRAIPYLRHEFLLALEEHGCASPDTGWQPAHLVFEDPQGMLIAALPMYLKGNSFGEFVFDWTWAEAYQRAGLDYYPKLVVAPPFTPATGPRLLIAPHRRSAQLAEEIVATAIQVARNLDVSSLHWLFANDDALATAEPSLLLPRLGYQFHWHNREWSNFDAFLAAFQSKRRKEARRERRLVSDAGVVLRRVLGCAATADEIETFYRLYRDTFRKYGNYPALTLDCFRALARTMGDAVLYVFAERDGRIIAGSYFLIGADTLYGRYWGAFEDIPALHFEACYYQGIEFCLERGLSRFEPGAQGEHKIARGFDPIPTWSYHWIANPAFRNGIDTFLRHERERVQRYLAGLAEHSAYRRESD